jgi:hypothetical protein
MNAPPRSIRSENRHPPAGKTRLRLTVLRTRFGDPHPQTLSQACAAFFQIATACSYGFLRERTSSSHDAREESG